MPMRQFVTVEEEFRGLICKVLQYVYSANQPCYPEVSAWESQFGWEKATVWQRSDHANKGVPFVNGQDTQVNHREIPNERDELRYTIYSRQKALPPTRNGPFRQPSCDFDAYLLTFQDRCHTKYLPTQNTKRVCPRNGIQKVVKGTRSTREEANRIQR